MEKPECPVDSREAARVAELEARVMGSLTSKAFPWLCYIDRRLGHFTSVLFVAAWFWTQFKFFAAPDESQFSAGCLAALVFVFVFVFVPRCMCMYGARMTGEPLLGDVSSTVEPW